MPHTTPLHTTRLRVRYADTDQMGVAHHGAYVTWCEVARIDWLRSIGLSYAAMEKDGVLMPVTRVDIRYRRPLRFDDNMDIETALIELGVCRVVFENTIFRSDDRTRCTEARIELATVGRAGSPIKIPENIRTILAAHQKA